MNALNNHISRRNSFHHSRETSNTVHFWWYEFVDTEGQFAYSADNSCRRRGNLPKVFRARNGFQEQAFTVRTIPSILYNHRQQQWTQICVTYRSGYWTTVRLASVYSNRSESVAFLHNNTGYLTFAKMNRVQTMSQFLA
jgi:hypothetical protein